MDKEIKEENDYYFKKNIELSQLNTSLRKQRDDLQQRIDECLTHLNIFINEERLSQYDTLKILVHAKNILKGDDTNES